MRRKSLLALIVASLLLSLAAIGSATPPYEAIREGQRRTVKIYGAGGRRQLEAYQTGILISPEGHVLTALSYVLDADEVTVVLDDGRRLRGQWLGSDPVLELAVLKLPTEGETLPYFALEEAPTLEVGERVLALSNLYGIAVGAEPVSVLQGVVSAIVPLAARRGRFQANYRGPVYVVDAQANNPGAAGGALVNWQGQLAGILGKELRSDLTGAWLHYALPVDALYDSVQAMLEGETVDPSELDLPSPDTPLTARRLGVLLTPDLLPRTPPFIDAIVPGSAAAAAGLRPDDLIVFVGAEPTASCREVGKALGQFDESDQVQVSVLRDGQLMEFSLRGAN